jgi:hypothetical protein
MPSLNANQFNVEQSILRQGNPSEEITRSRGIQNLTSNVYKPSFSSDYTSLRSFRSPASSGGQEEDEE